jgi:predicted PurR-regulated permease PerM
MPVHTQVITIDTALVRQGDSLRAPQLTQVNVYLTVEEQPANERLSRDTTAIITSRDTPLQQIQKRIVSVFNPAQITDLFSLLISLLGNLLFGFFSVTFIAYYFLKEQRLFGSAIQTIVPHRYEAEMGEALNTIRRLLSRYFLGLVTQISAISVLVFIGLSVLGVRNALLIAIFAGLINIIPYVGPIISGIFASMITISSNLDADFYTVTTPALIRVLAVLSVVKVIDDTVLQPNIFSRSVLAHPLEVFIVILVAETLGGITGMIVALPAYTVLRVIGGVFLSEFKIVRKLNEQIEGTLGNDSAPPAPPSGTPPSPIPTPIPPHQVPSPPPTGRRP